MEEVEGETEASDPVQPFVREEVAHLRRVHDGEAEELCADVGPGTAHGGVFGEDDAAELFELAGPLGLVGEAVGKGAEIEAQCDDEVRDDSCRFGLPWCREVGQFSEDHAGEYIWSNNGYTFG